VVTPPFWKAWWFIVSTPLIAVLIGFFVYKKRIKYITNREEQKSIIQQRIVETKLEALQSQMNPHFTFNAMNSIQNYIIDNDIDNALMYLAEFAKLIRKTLDNSSLPLITLGEEISYLQSYSALENMRHNNSVEVEINYAKIDLPEIDIPPMLIQPFVENVFVHAFTSEHINPKLTIEFIVENEFLVCKITDNGAGMSKTLSGQIHESKGLILVKERLNLLNKSNTNSFQIETKLGIGTSITLQLEIPNYND
jgi:sensor histidine kinase YesM